MLKQPLPEYASNRILEAYVHVLEAHDQDEDLIAFYASHLEKQSAIESYARFLLSESSSLCIRTFLLSGQRSVTLMFVHL